MQRGEENDKGNSMMDKSASMTPQHQKKNKSKSDQQLLHGASVEEIIGFDDDGKGGNSSTHFLSSTLLDSAKVKRIFRNMMNLDDEKNKARVNIVNLLTLEKKALQWYGDKIPFSYFGISLPEKIIEWGIQDILSTEQVHVLCKKLQNEINLLEYGMYILSEQEMGDLGLMLPKIFIKARNDAIMKGLVKDSNNGNVVVLDDDDDDDDNGSVDPDGLKPEFLTNLTHKY